MLVRLTVRHPGIWIANQGGYAAFLPVELSRFLESSQP
jgi:hypothetical protein